MNAATVVTPTGDRAQRADAQRNRRQILDSTRAVFSELGIDAPVEAVARRAGLGVGTLYRHFPTKDDLIGEMVADQFRLFAGIIRDALASDAEPWESFSGALRASAQAASENVAIQDAMATPTHWAIAEPARLELLEVTGFLVERAKAAGVVRSDLDVWDIPMIMCGLCVTMTAAKPEVAERGWERLLELLLDGLRPPR